MAKSTIYTALDLRDGFYQILIGKHPKRHAVGVTRYTARAEECPSDVQQMRNAFVALGARATSKTYSFAAGL
ncbi:Reverse transcriptase [Phytophthora palmivora]|uniref:Reverse transcriptase n=1 Tax=Phytophthora palmivora TaxID=4796 RepID=A0A2P4Y7Z8_9STRA|nr:Reverse transcriptase [Phytophthora palmivora]